MKVGSFKRDPRAMREGEWVPAGPEFGELTIKTKAMGTAFADAQQAMLRREARLAAGEANIKQEKRNAIFAECLIQHCLLDVKGLEHDDGSAVTFPEFCEMLRLEEFSELAIVATNCAAQVGRRAAVQAEDAAGNS